MAKNARKILLRINQALKAGDLETAEELASYGRVRSPLQRMVWHFLYGISHKLDVDWAASELCEMFLEAVIKKDLIGLRGIVQEVELFQPNPELWDKERALALFAKQVLNKAGKKGGVATFAAMMNSKTASPDGHSALRRRLKALGYPIAKEKAGPRKKTRTRKKRSVKS
jgi:hypothetical protein